MHLDSYTSIFASTLITTTTCLALLFFSLSRKENRLFLWAALSSGSLAGAQFLLLLRGKIPDFFSILIANVLAVLCLIAFFEIIRRFTRTRTWERFVGPSILVIQSLLFYWYTYYHPDFSIRVVIASFSYSIMTVFILKLLLLNFPKGQHFSYIFAAGPFFLVFLISIIRIFLFFSGMQFPENSYESPAYALSATVYGVVSVWMTLSVVFITSNTLQTQMNEIIIELRLKNNELQVANNEINRLQGIIPICANCKKIRDGEGYWNQVESYIEKRSDALFSHGICEECAKELYGDTKWYKKRYQDKEKKE